jgi:hypothetical protein
MGGLRVLNSYWINQVCCARLPASPMPRSRPRPHGRAAIDVAHPSPPAGACLPGRPPPAGADPWYRRSSEPPSRIPCHAGLDVQVLRGHPGGPRPQRDPQREPRAAAGSGRRAGRPRSACITLLALQQGARRVAGAAGRRRWACCSAGSLQSRAWGGRGSWQGSAAAGQQRASWPGSVPAGQQAAEWPAAVGAPELSRAQQSAAEAAALVLDLQEWGLPQPRLQPGPGLQRRSRVACTRAGPQLCQCICSAPQPPPVVGAAEPPWRPIPPATATATASTPPPLFLLASHAGPPHQLDLQRRAQAPRAARPDLGRPEVPRPARHRPQVRLALQGRACLPAGAGQQCRAAGAASAQRRLPSSCSAHVPRVGAGAWQLPVQAGSW